MNIIESTRMEHNMDRKMDLHVTLPEAMLGSLDRAAEARGLKRAEALRLAVEVLLREWEKEHLDAELRAYVRDMASGSSEWVRLTAKDNARRLREETAW